MIDGAERDEEALAQAGGWLVRLQRDEVQGADAEGFEAWLAERPGNAAAYRRVLEVWQVYGAAAPQVLAELETAARSVELRARSGRPSLTRRWMVGAGGFAIAAGLALAVLPPVLLQPSVETYATARGERRQVKLEDGTTIDLNAETRLTVTYARGERQVAMAEGEALFDVAHDASRPFTVAASNQVVRVLGTQFDVRNRTGELAVTVASGRVEVRPQAAAASRKAYLLTRGQRLEIDRSGVAEMQVVDPSEAFSWRSGRLVYRGEPLSEVVADLNRQFTQPILIGDPELADIPITGVIVLDDPAAVTTRLSLMLPLRTVPSDQGLLLLRK